MRVSLSLILLIIIGAGVLISGIRPFAVVSSSMEPLLPVGSLVVTSRINPSEIGVGDVIAFHEPRFGTIVHRVVLVETVDKQVTIHTKGDANTSGDAWTVSPDAVYGRVMITIPYVGYAAIVANSMPLLVIAVIVLVIISIAWTSNRDRVRA